MAATRNTHCRVIVAFEPREVTLTLVDSNGTVIDEERFGLVSGASDIQPRSVAIDVWNLLYQCANDAINGDE